MNGNEGRADVRMPKSKEVSKDASKKGDNRAFK